MLTVVQPIIPDYELFNSYVRIAFDEKRFTNGGPLVSMLELRLRELIRAQNLVLLNNGTMALELSLRALGVKGEVITTPFTFCASSQSIVWAGAKPVFVDIDADNLTIDPSAIEAAITPQTEAILGVHVYGKLCNFEAIESIAKKHQLAVIYDACHAFNTTWKGKPLGSFGDATTYSFHATKLFHTAEGGAVETRDSLVAEKIRLLRNFGIESEDVITLCGTNAKMSELSAAMGLSVLPKIGYEYSIRARIRDKYNDTLKHIHGVRLLMGPESDIQSQYYYVIRVNNNSRDRVQMALKSNGILARRYFYPLTSDIPLEQDRVIAHDLTHATTASNEVLALPFHSGVTDADIERIAEIIEKSI